MAGKAPAGTCNQPTRCKFTAKQALFLIALSVSHHQKIHRVSLMFCLLNSSSILFKSYFNGHTQFWLITSCSLIYFCQTIINISLQICVFFNRIKHYAICERCYNCMKHFGKCFGVKKHDNPLTSGNLKSISNLKPIR